MSTPTVDQVLKSVSIRQLTGGDAIALASFYNGLSEESIRTFRPLGTATTECICRGIGNENDSGTKCDMIAIAEGSIIAWCFIWNLDQPDPMFGLAVADRYQGRGIGQNLAARLLEEAGRRNIPRVTLTVVKDNARAQRIYTKVGFTFIGEFLNDEDGLNYYRMERCIAQGSATKAPPW